MWQNNVWAAALKSLRETWGEKVISKSRFKPTAHLQESHAHALSPNFPGPPPGKSGPAHGCMALPRGREPAINEAPEAGAEFSDYAPPAHTTHVKSLRVKTSSRNLGSNPRARRTRRASPSPRISPGLGSRVSSTSGVEGSGGGEEVSAFENSEEVKSWRGGEVVAASR